jgi:hypothetical protein
MRVLVTGEACSRYGPDLEEDGVDIVGCAESVDEASRLLHSLRPDVVVLEPHSTENVQLLSSSVPVVVLAPAREETPEDGNPARLETETCLLQIALALASAMPSRRFICLSGVGEG